MLAATADASGTESAATSVSRAWRRRSALFTAILLSGGLLLFPRLPLLAVLLVLCFIDRGATLTLSRRMLWAWLWLAAVVLLTLLRPGGVDIEPTLIRLANFAGALALLRMYLEAREGSLAEDLRAILPWLSAQAILTVVFALFFRPLALPLVIEDAVYDTFLLIFTWHETIETSSVFVRPDGLFFEPGVFQIYLNIHLFLSLFPRRDWRQAGVATVAVLATQSTTGLIIASLQFAVVAWPVLSRGDYLQRAFKFMLILMVAVPLVVVTAANVQDKFFGDYRGSAWSRQYDLLTGINIILQYPLTGIGFSHERYTALTGQFGFTGTELSEASIDKRNSSNGLVQVVYSVGFIFALPWLIGLLRNPLLRPAWLLGIILILSLGSEALAFTPFFAMFAFGGMTRRQPVRTQAV